MGPRKLEVVYSKSPPLKSWEVRIAVAAAAVCGSDLKFITKPTEVPMIPGHEFAGAIIETSFEAQDAFHFGDRVTAFPMISCLACKSCLEGKFRDCESKISLGFQIPGAFSEEVVVDSRFVIHLQDGLTYEQGALVEHLCCGYRLAQELVSHQLPRNSHIVLIGDGPIALADLQMLVLLNYHNITVIGKHTSRLDLALRFGAKHVLDFREINFYMNNHKFPIIDVCIFSAMAEETLHKILPHISSKGFIFPQTRIRRLDILDYLKKSKILLGRAFAYEINDFEIIMNLIKEGKIDTEILISKRGELAELPEIISTLYKCKFGYKTIMTNQGFDETLKKYQSRNL